MKRQWRATTETLSTLTLSRMRATVVMTLKRSDSRTPFHKYIIYSIGSTHIVRELPMLLIRFLPHKPQKREAPAFAEISHFVSS